MTLKVRYLACVFVWVGAVFGLQFLATLPRDLGEALLGHSLCGPWGCLPPLQALVAMHAFWVLLLIPLVLWAVRSWPPVWLWSFGVALTGLGLLGLAVVAGWEVRQCWLKFPDLRPYVVQRVLYVLATLIHVPLVQVTLAGLTCWLAGKWRWPARTLSPVAAPPGPAAVLGDRPVQAGEVGWPGVVDNAAGMGEP
jgi:hypothetical protein